MAGDPAAAPPQGFAQRLGQWVTWTDAISLSAALNAGAAKGPAAPARAAPATRFEHEVQGVRDALAKAAADDAALNGEAEFQPYRRHYLAKQQAMDAALTPLRERLRAALAAASPRIAPLASLDAAMAQVLAGQERALLASVPVLLERHFERLRAAQPASAPASDAAAAPPAPPAPWLATFRHDLRQLLLAELDLRLQPVEGLLDALSASAAAPSASPVTSL